MKKQLLDIAKPSNHSLTFTARIDQQDLDRLGELHRARVAPNTWIARESDLRQFYLWSRYYQVDPKQATDADVCLWLSHMATDNALNRLRYCTKSRKSTLYRGCALSIRTIRRRLSSLKWFYDQQDESTRNAAASPLVLDQLAGISRSLSSKPKRAAAISAAKISTVIEQVQGSDFTQLRDQLIFALGFAGALRVSDLASIQIENIQLFQHGAILGFENRKRRSDYSQVQIVAGRRNDTCPVNLLQRYISKIGTHSGVLFRKANRNGESINRGLHPTSIARIIKKFGAIGAPPFANVSGHSLRRGFIDSALSNGAPISEVMKISGHKDPKTLMLYLDDCGQFSNHPGANLY